MLHIASTIVNADWKISCKACERNIQIIHNFSGSSLRQTFLSYKPTSCPFFPSWILCPITHQAMLRKRSPLIICCAFIFVAWYVVLFVLMKRPSTPGALDSPGEPSNTGDGGGQFGNIMNEVMRVANAFEAELESQKKILMQIQSHWTVWENKGGVTAAKLKSQAEHSAPAVIPILVIACNRVTCETLPWQTHWTPTVGWTLSNHSEPGLWTRRDIWHDRLVWQSADPYQTAWSLWYLSSSTAQEVPRLLQNLPALPVGTQPGFQHLFILLSCCCGGWFGGNFIWIHVAWINSGIKRKVNQNSNIHKDNL